MRLPTPDPSSPDWRKRPLPERAAMMARLVQEPGWQLFCQMLAPELRTRVQDADSREAFLYEAIRLQAIQEALALPEQVMRQMARMANRSVQVSVQPHENPMVCFPNTGDPTHP